MATIALVYPQAITPRCQICYWTILTQNDGGGKHTFQIGKRLFLSFGVFYAFRRLDAFLTALTIILMAFAQMFVTVVQNTLAGR